jgi:hypothetical protein
MSTLIVILLAVIAYILWKIYRQKENENEQIESEKRGVEWEAQKKEKYKDYPHIYGKLKGNWLEVFADMAEKGAPQLKIQFMLMVGESTKIDYSEGSMKYDALWGASKELLEHLDKYHEDSILEHEIALTAYWQEAAMAMDDLIKSKPNTDSLSSGAHTAPIEGQEVEKTPFTDIEKIAVFSQKSIAILIRKLLSSMKTAHSLGSLKVRS